MYIFEIVEYLNDASEKIMIKKVIKKIIFLFLVFNLLFLGELLKNNSLLQ